MADVDAAINALNAALARGGCTAVCASGSGDALCTLLQCYDGALMQHTAQHSCSLSRNWKQASMHVGASGLDWRGLGAVIQAGKHAGNPVAQSVDIAARHLNMHYAVSSGLDWRELGALIEAEKRAGNPVAALVGGLALERNAATLLLRNTLDEEVDSDEEDAPLPQPMPVSLSSLKCQQLHRSGKVLERHAATLRLPN